MFPNLVHSSSVFASNLTSASEGVVVSPICVIGPNVTFGNHVYLNFMVGVGHDTIFGDYIQVNPGVQIGGGTTIGNEVLVGSGSSIRQGLKVKKGATIALGSVVLHPVPEGVTVNGNPAKRLKLPGFSE